jgi:hypothetical protein
MWLPLVRFEFFNHDKPQFRPIRVGSLPTNPATQETSQQRSLIAPDFQFSKCSLEKKLIFISVIEKEI